jgi:hypothetical protein
MRKFGEKLAPHRKTVIQSRLEQHQAWTFYKTSTAETVPSSETWSTLIDRLSPRENIPMDFFSTRKRNKPASGLVTAIRAS